ncbi:hypothetical protein BGZ68_001276 [Mortierella alpina]|nr:hypothetical protein BGZ68_001276 [Mortierella alpina]
MSKSGAPSATVSASASASSHDPHSLPPNIKGLIQRYLAVSLPTITLSPEIIVALDAADEIIPPRIQVTMRWWKEDTACSLSVYPKLNSPLPESVIAHQNLLRQYPHHRQLQQQQQHGIVSNTNLTELRPLTGPNARSLAASQAQAQNKAQNQAHAQTQVQPEAQTQQRSAAGAFLKRPWAGARLLRAFRKGKTKAQAGRSSATAASADEPTDGRLDVDPGISGEADMDIDKRPASTPEPATKPLPSLPEAAYPITVAYPIRCSLEQLRRYFIEMTTLTLDVQVTPELSVLATVPNLADLFHNIHGTFSGVFPFATVLQNDNPRLAADHLFQRRVVLGMVVFQAWSQDTSEVGDTSDESESISTGSIVIPSPTKGAVSPTPLQVTPHHRQPIQHQQPPAFTPPEQLSFSYSNPLKQSRPPWHPSYGEVSHHAVNDAQQQQHRRPYLSEQQTTHLSILSTGLGQRHQEQQQGRRAVTPTRGTKQDSHGMQPPVHGLDREPPHPQPVQRFDSKAFMHGQRPVESRIPGEAASTRERHSHSHKHHARQASIDARPGSSHSPGRRLRLKIPVPEIRRHPTTASHRPAQHGRRPVVEDQSDSVGRRRSEDTNFTSLNSQGSRSRPRAGATAAAIGRLDTVLARAEGLRHGMNTSLDLDPEEVRARTARNTRTSPQNNDPDDSSYLACHENLPYWPAKSRFSLELSIPTAYLTSRGLLKGSAKQKKCAVIPSAFLRQGASSMVAQREGWGRESSEYSQSSQQDSQQRRRFVAQRASPSSHFQESPQTPLHFTKETQGGRPQQRQPHESSGSRSVRPAGSNAPAPRILRRSERPIRFEKLSPRSELERLRKAQEESSLPHYQSFLPGDSQIFITAPSAPVFSRDKIAQDWSSQQRPPYRPRAHKDVSTQQEHLRQQTTQSTQPRKSKSYPPNPSSSAPSRKHRRRLSSNDRLQIRMNPKAGDIDSLIPNLFPARSMSALIRPEYRPSQESRSSRSSRSSSFSNGLRSFGSSSSSSSSMGLEEKEYRQYGGSALEGRQSRLQKRTHPSSHLLHPDIQPSTKRHQHRQEYSPRTKERRKRRSSRARSKSKRHARGSKSDGDGSMHPQHFNFVTQCDLLLTPDVMAACMMENISVEVWKLNKKRQTMTELGSAKLPLHRVLSRILRTTTAASTFSPAAGAGVRTGTAPASTRRGGHRRFPSEEEPRPSTREEHDGIRRSHIRAASGGRSKEGWRLEPSVYDIRSRSGTIIGQLDAEVWIHPRSRSDSMVSAAA